MKSNNIMQFNAFGRLGGDPVLKKGKKSGKDYVEFSMAVNKSYLDKETDEWNNTASWYNVISFENIEAILNLKKGDDVIVHGSPMVTSKGQASFVASVVGKALIDKKNSKKLSEAKAA